MIWGVHLPALPSNPRVRSKRWRYVLYHEGQMMAAVTHKLSVDQFMQLDIEVDQPGIEVLKPGDTQRPTD